MKISFFKLYNFRKLQECLIDLSDTTTVFVGANNSGKTSAINALEKFIGSADYKIVFNDIFISYRKSINLIGEEWIKDEAQVPNNLNEWHEIMPALDLCFLVSENELRHVAHIIPTLKWQCGELGIRLAFQPKKIEELFTAYKFAYNEARKTESAKEGYSGQLYPQNLCDFLKKNLESYFNVKSYILDPSKLRDSQNTSELFECSDINPLKNLIKVHTIPAQRGFRDIGYNSEADKDSLSAQLRKYYDRHLNPEKGTSPDDLEILGTMTNAAQAFDGNLKQKFEKPLSEL